MPTFAETDLHFHGLPRPVRLVNCAPLLEMIRDIFSTWPFRAEACDPSASPVVSVVRRKGGHYRIEAPWLDEPIQVDTRVCAFSSIVVDVIYAWLEANPPLLCLHCAAVEFDGRLVVFPNTNQAGKSSLAVRLMADGRVCHGDDLLALTPEGQGMSFGVPPRLRLPLPESEKKLAEFVRAHGGPADKWNRYIASGIPSLAPFGQSRPIGAFVMLERRAGGPAELVPADAADSLRNMVYQNLMRRGGARDVFDHSKRLTEELPCWRLQYARLDDAASVLRTAFASARGTGFAPPASGGGMAASPVPERAAPARSGASPLSRAPSRETFVRRPGVLARQGQGEHFLIQETGDAIFYLNALGWAIWELLAEPLSEAEAVALLASVFPETPRAGIARDVAALFEELEEMDLILKA